MTTVPSSDREQRKNRIITLLLLAVLVISISVFLVERKESSIIVVTFSNGTRLETEVADTPEKLLFGLAFRETLPQNGGMLYIFEAAGRHRVTTKAYRFPVDMIWIDESHHVVHLMENAGPCTTDPCPWYGPPPDAVRYLIQTEAGFIRRQGIEVGEELKYALRM
jgi:uncharacterized membrane protein (UPF0127 family)